MLTKSEVMDRSYLDVRSALVEMAATLDRYDRGKGDTDERAGELFRALRLLADSRDAAPRRCEQILNFFTED